MCKIRISFLLLLLIFISQQFILVKGILKVDISSQRKPIQEFSPIQLQFNELLSKQNQIPISPNILPFCQTSNGFNKLSAHLFHRYQLPSSFDAQLKVKRNYQFACTRDYSDEEIADLKKLIDDDYRININFDEFPILEDGNKLGIQLGKKEGGKYYINNFIYLLINTYEIESKAHIIDSFFGHPISYKVDSSLWDTVDFDSVIMKSDNKQEIKGQTLTFIYQIHLNVITKQNDRITREQVFKRLKLITQLENESIILLWIPLAATILLLSIKLCKINNNKSNLKNEEKTQYQKVDTSEDNKNSSKIEIKDGQISDWQTLETEVFRPPSKQGLLASLIGFGSLLLLNVLLLIGIEIINQVLISQKGSEELFKNNDDLVIKFLYSASISSLVYGKTTSVYYSRFQGNSNRSQIIIALLFFYTSFLLILAFLEEKNHIKLIDYEQDYLDPQNNETHTQLFIFAILIPLPILVGYISGYIKSKTELKLRFNLPSMLPLPYANHKTFIFKRALLCGFLNILLVIYPLNKITHSIVVFNIILFNQILLIIIILLVLLQISLMTVFITFKDLNRGYYKWQWKSFWMGGSVGYLKFVENLEIKDIVYLNQYILPLCMAIVLICGSSSTQFTYNFVNYHYYKFLINCKKQNTV